MLADKFDVKYEIEDITPALEGLNCYKRRDDAVKRIFPEYNPKNFKFKIELKSNDVIKNLPSVYYATIIDDNGIEKSKRLPTGEYLQIMAASNFKQRSQMTMLYYHAKKKSLCQLDIYKTQVYQLATYLAVPKEIINRTSTTDTYPAEQTQEDFFF